MVNYFDIYITADHGNIEALLGRKLNGGIVVDTKGQRVRVYDRESAREKAMSNYEELMEIESEKYALPDNYYAVAQTKAEYFGKAGQPMEDYLFRKLLFLLSISRRSKNSGTSRKNNRLR